MQFFVIKSVNLVRVGVGQTNFKARNLAVFRISVLKLPILGERYANIEVLHCYIDCCLVALSCMREGTFRKIAKGKGAQYGLSG